MPTYIVLFRAINVAGKNLISMKDLVTALEEKGFSDIKTYIQSGNVLLNSRKKPESEIRHLVEQRFDIKPEVFAFTTSEFNRCVDDNPYPTAAGNTVHLYFCKTEPKVNSDLIEQLKASSEAYQVKGKTFYLHAPDGIGRSKLATKIESCLGVCATGRNFNTVLRLQKMINSTK